MSVPTSTDQPATLVLDPQPDAVAALESAMDTMAATVGILSALLASPDFPVTLRVSWGSQLEMRRDNLLVCKDRLQRAILDVALYDRKERAS